MLFRSGGNPPPLTQPTTPRVTATAPQAPLAPEPSPAPTPDPKPAAAPPEPATPADPAPEPAPRAQPSQLDDQAKRLADFFNGEVVALDGPITELEAS